MMHCNLWSPDAVPFVFC